MADQRVRLIAIEPRLARRLDEDPADSSPDDRLVLHGVEQITRDIVQHMLRRSAEPLIPWCGYLTADPARAQVVGTCAFKSPPYGDGEVEIAYFTFEPFEGKGYGRAAARALVDLARASGGLRRVVAHTLPEANPSTRILRSCGFRFVGAVEDPEDGTVWRWELEV